MRAVQAVRAGRDEPRGGRAIPAAAATVVLLRPGPRGLEVLLTRRPSTMAFAPDVHVFPGGRVDAADARPDHPLADGLTADAASASLAGTLSASDALAHHVAAVRETLEETGIRIAAGSLVPLTRWVTPESLARRFDVRFFAAGVPAGTDIVAPSSEVASSRWVTPAEAIREAAAGSLEMYLPTLVTLEQLDGLADLAAVEAAFAPGDALGPPVIGPLRGGVADITQRWVAGIAGRGGQGWLVGNDEVILVDPADPTGVTMTAIDVALAGRGARIVGILLTGRRPAQHAGVELYAAGRGLPVAGGTGGASTYPFEVIGVGDAVSFGDIRLIVEAPDHPEPGAIVYRLPDGRRLPPTPGARGRA